jgi:hypothetical protein
MSWSKEILPLSKMSTMSEKTKLKMRFSGEEYPDNVDKVSCKGRKPKVIINKYRDYFVSFGNRSISSLDPRVENILVGVCRVNWYRKNGEQRPLSLRKLVYLLGKFDEITASKVSWFLDIEERQSRRYLQACELALEFIERDKVAVSAMCDDYFDEDDLDAILLSR